MKPSPPFPVRDVVLIPGPSPDYFPRLRDKIWEWPGDEATQQLQVVHVGGYLWDGTEVEDTLVLDPGHVLEDVWHMLKGICDE